MSSSESSTVLKVVKSMESFTQSLAQDLQPRTFKEVLGWSCWLWISCPVYRQAIIRGTSYFLTELDVERPGDEGDEKTVDEVGQARRYLNKHFTSTDEMLLALQEAIGFGGTCLYLHFPLDKMLICPCGATRPMEDAMRHGGVTFDPEKVEYVGTCVQCKKRVTFQVNQARVNDKVDQAKIIRIPLSVIRQTFNPFTRDRRIFVDMNLWEAASKGVRDGDPMVHATTHVKFIEAVCKDSELMLREPFFHYIGFNEASVLEQTLDGWSLPPFFYAFPDVVALVLLQKYNQTILKDYVLPLRYVAPPPTVGAARYSSGQMPAFDPAHAAGASAVQFTQKVGSFISALRASPDKIGIAPYPIDFGYLGLDGKQMITVDVMRYYADQLMQDMGIPPEFYRGGINAQVATPSHYGYMLFERFWGGKIANIVKAYQWLTDRIGQAQRWPHLEVDLVPPVQYHDLSTVNIMAERNMQGKLSDSTFDRMLGVHTEYEAKMVQYEQTKRNQEYMNEDAKASRKELVDSMLSEASPDMRAYEQMQMQQQMQQQQGQGGAPAPAGGPPPSGVPTAGPQALAPENAAMAAPMNPAEQQVMDKVSAMAQQTAQQLFQYPVPERANILRDMEAQDPNYAALVKEALDDLDHQASRAGLEAARSGQMPMQ